MSPLVDPADPVPHLPALRRYALALTRHRDTADDLVQDALVKAYKYRRNYRGEGMRAWLFAIMHNTFRDDRRRAGSETVRLAGLAPTISSSSPPSQDHVVRLAQIQAGFLELPTDQRAALHLVAVEGFAYQEAADTLGVPIGTLMSRLGRARAALRRFEDDVAPPISGTPRLRIVGGADDA